jgi:hypothetical protein
MRPLLRLQRSLLAVPSGRNPAFDPLHPASATPRFSGVSVGGNFINLMNAKKGVLNGTPIPVISPGIGVSSQMSGATTEIAFPGAFAAVVELPMTMAMIIEFGAVTGSPGVFQTGTNTGGWDFHINGTTMRITAANVSDNDLTGMTVAAGIPYFAAVSATSAGIKGVLTNLQTGQITTGTHAAQTPGSTNGTITLGENNSTNFTMAAAMTSGAALSAAQLLEWAQDPWSFWYPPTFDLSMMLRAVVGSNFVPHNPWPQIGPLIAQ